jgi:hypothetical protein
MGKKSRSGSGTNIPVHISRAVKQFFRLKYLNSFMRDPGIFLTPDPGLLETIFLFKLNSLIRDPGIFLIPDSG